MLQISSGWGRVLYFGDLLTPPEVGSSGGTHPKPGPVSSQSRNPGMGGEASGVIGFKAQESVGDFFWVISKLKASDLQIW